MQSNFRKPQSMPRTQAKTYLAFWVWIVFISSVLLFISSVFVTTWTSNGPTFSSVQESFSKKISN